MNAKISAPPVLPAAFTMAIISIVLLAPSASGKNLSLIGAGMEREAISAVKTTKDTFPGNFER